MNERVARPRAVLVAASLLVGIAALVAIAAAAKSEPSAGAEAAARPIRLEDATMIIEVNSTDRDAGIQVFLDGEPWSAMAVSAPEGARSSTSTPGGA